MRWWAWGVLGAWVVMGTACLSATPGDVSSDEDSALEDDDLTNGDRTNDQDGLDAVADEAASADVEDCLSGDCACVAQDHKVCIGGSEYGNLYWYDSCGIQGGLAETCGCGCSEGACHCCPDWNCSGWSTCTCGKMQTQACSDKSGCGDETSTPPESQACDPCGNGQCDCGETSLSCPQDCACNAASCPAVVGYNASCNAKGFCEYANPDTTGWKQHDVWIYVPKGSFTMGSPSSENGHHWSEAPTHEVTISKGYLIGKYEVTVAQYEACRAASSSTCTTVSTAQWDGEGWGTNTSAKGRATHPQNGLTWTQAKAVCAWLGGNLPSEARWEFAATGPVHWKFPWGDEPEADCTLAVYDQDGEPSRPWGCDNCLDSGCSGTSPVGSIPAGGSWSGAEDMAGNVWEWVLDCWHDDFTGAPTDGGVWEETECTNSQRPLRGGSFADVSDYLRSSVRSNNNPSWGQALYGARCLKPEPQCGPDCSGKVCGDDGCTGSCGTCGGGKFCQSGQCVCLPNDHKACSGGNLYWFDSCGAQGDVAQTCTLGCSNAACNVSTSVEWVTIPGGTFQMGASDIDSTTLPVHAVTVPTFEMSRTEVLVCQYLPCQTAGKCASLKCGQDGTDHPAVCMIWSEAKAFCEWAGGRLCSEAEWEFAARNGSANNLYPWGDTDPTCDNAVFKGSALGCTPTHTEPVCSKMAGNNQWGVCDLAGNAWEWVADPWHPSYDTDKDGYQPDGDGGMDAPSDGSVWTEQGQADVVIKSGSFISDAVGIRASYRLGNGSAAYSGGFFGARCCRSP